MKDPNKPTGKRSAYMYFTAGDERIMLKTEHPGKAGCMVYRLRQYAAAGGAVTGKEAELGVTTLALSLCAPRYDWATLGPGGCCRVPYVLGLPLPRSANLSAIYCVPRSDPPSLPRTLALFTPPPPHSHPTPPPRSLSPPAAPDWAFSEIAKELGKRWTELNDADKAQYVEKATEDDLRYKREMASYAPVQDEVASAAGKVKTKAKTKTKKGGKGGISYAVMKRELESVGVKWIVQSSCRTLKDAKEENLKLYVDVKMIWGNLMPFRKLVETSASEGGASRRVDWERVAEGMNRLETVNGLLGQSCMRFSYGWSTKVEDWPKTDLRGLPHIQIKCTKKGETGMDGKIHTGGRIPEYVGNIVVHIH